MKSRASTAAVFAAGCAVAFGSSGYNADPRTMLEACFKFCSSFGDMLGSASGSCEAVCGAIDAQLPTPCGQALLRSSTEHLVLLSYSSGNIFEALAILLGESDVMSESKYARFITGLHLNNFGSPESCAAIEDAHYCVGNARLRGYPGQILPRRVSLGLCVPQSCDSKSVEAFIKNITYGSSPSSMNDDGSSNSNVSGGERRMDFIDNRFSGQDLLQRTSFSCGDEGHLTLDAGTIVVLLVIGALASLILVGTALDSQRRQSSKKAPPLLRAPLSNGSPPQEQLQTLPMEPKTVGNGLTKKEEWAQGIQHPSGQHIVRETSGSHSNPLRVGASYTEEGRMDRTDRTDWCSACVECFSLFRNVEGLFSPPEENDFRALHGVRTLTILWEMSMHALLFAVVYGPGYTNFLQLIPGKWDSFFVG